LACTCTRPRPSLTRLNQPRGNRVAFNISNSPPQRPVISNAMVVRFILPERPARSPQEEIRGAGRGALDPSSDNGHRAGGLHHHMNVIRHDDPGQQFIQTILCVSQPQRVLDDLGNFWLAEPMRPGSVGIQQPIACDERFAWFGLSFFERDRGSTRQRTVQTPGYEEDGVWGVVVRQISAVIGHFESAGRKACSTESPGRRFFLLKCAF
jgi:hypothetical protein